MMKKFADCDFDVFCEIENYIYECHEKEEKNEIQVNNSKIINFAKKRNVILTREDINAVVLEYILNS